MPRFWRHKQIVGNSEFWRRRRKFLGIQWDLRWFLVTFWVISQPKFTNFFLFVIRGSISGARSTLECMMGFLQCQNPFLDPDLMTNTHWGSYTPRTRRDTRLLQFQNLFLVQILSLSSHCVFHTGPNCVSARYSAVQKSFWSHCDFTSLERFSGSSFPSQFNPKRTQWSITLTGCGDRP